MLKHSLAVFLIAASATFAVAQEDGKVHQPKLTPQHSGTTQLLISVSPVNSRVVWAAGTGGTYVVTTDGGETWKAAVVITTETAPNFTSGEAAWTPDEGRTWFHLPEVSSFWAVAFADPEAGWFVGNGGQILKISF